MIMQRTAVGLWGIRLMIIPPLEHEVVMWRIPRQCILREYGQLL